VNREDALSAFSAIISGGELPDSIPFLYRDEVLLLPPAVLEQIKIDELPNNVWVGVGTARPVAYEFEWNGTLMRDRGDTLRAYISHEIPPRYWHSPVSARFYLDLINKCVQRMQDSVQGLSLEEYDTSHDSMILLQYSFPVTGSSLGEAYRKAARIQQKLESPADQVMEDVTKSLARAADKLVQGHYSAVSELITQVDNAHIPAEKGSALEALMEVLFSQVPGLVVSDRDLHTKTEELDLVVLNGSQDPVFSKDKSIILVECKNWTEKVGRPEFSGLEIKMHNRYNRCNLAFFISWSGFTEKAWRETLRLSRGGYVIVCLSGADIRRAALAGNFPDFLRAATLRAINT
jgi:hypothetical protein